MTPTTNGVNEVGSNVAELAVGQTLGQYVIVDVLGRGGMATVYKARQSNPDRFVALKILSSELADEPEFVARFRHEANIAASVDHPNVVPIYAVGEEHGAFFIAMRLVPGSTLTEVIRRDRPLSLDRACRILRQIADALDHAHRQGVIHRDLKPSNVMVEAGDRVTLTDFGIARARDETVVARTHGVIGTPHYMAPEQALGETVDYRADLYALGVVAYEMLAGKVPFQADTPLAVLHRQVYDAAPSIRIDRPDLPPALDSAIGRMLAKKPDERFPNASDFVSALGDVTTPLATRPTEPDSRTEPILPPVPPNGEKPTPDRSDLRPVALVVAIAVIALLVAIPTLGPRLIGGGGAPETPATSTPNSLNPASASATALAQAAPNTRSPDTPTAAPSPTIVLSPTSAPIVVPTRAAPTPTTRPALPGGTIVFVSDNPSDPSLYAISPTGRDLRQLSSGEARNPACSPNGESVAFESKRTGVNLIYLVRLAVPGALQAVTAGSGDDQLAAWNPNGKAIAFARARPGNTAIFTINLDDHQEHQLTPGDGGDWKMSYAPDGKQIVFTSTRKGSNDLWLMNADGTNVRQLTTGPGDKRDPSWSPDGKWIAFRSDRDGHHWDLYRVSPTDGRIVALTSDSIDKGSPAWSPDSRWILFPANRGGRLGVYVMSVDGSDWIPITSPPTIGGGATWCRS